MQTEDSVDAPAPAGGRALRDAFTGGIARLTLGLVRWRDGALACGPLELLKFGEPSLSAGAVEWPIEGGLLASAPGGRWRIGSRQGRLVASVIDYAPALPRPLYSLTQLPVHRLLMRLFLLRTRGPEPAPGVPATAERRAQAALVDAALCLGLSRVVRGPRLRTFVLLAAVYHVACWSTSGHTLGGVVLRQRVVASDGTRPTVLQSLVRFLVLPLALVRHAPVHDAIAGTEVVEA